MSDTAEAPVSLVGLIDSLVDPVPPPPISMMPQTWGWAVLAGVIALAVAAAIWRAVARHRANAYRRAALAELANARTTANLATLLRRTALAAYPRVAVAGLAGTDWTDFLDRSAPGGFPSDAREDLRHAFCREPSAPSQHLRDATARWIKTHRKDLPETAESGA